MPPANNSTKKIDVEFFTKPDGSEWVVCTLLKYQQRPTFVPSLRDLARIVDAMAVCEDLKYPPPARGRAFLLDFLRDVIAGLPYDRLAKKYKIPERDGDDVVDTNGARLKPTASSPLVLPASAARVTRNLGADEIEWSW